MAASSAYAVAAAGQAQRWRDNAAAAAAGAPRCAAKRCRLFANQTQHPNPSTGGAPLAQADATPRCAAADSEYQENASPSAQIVHAGADFEVLLQSVFLSARGVERRRDAAPERVSRNAK